ncbi:MAG: hypothetical protein COA67_07720 [Lutibacter sp.]|nr:MAG: hypothetical protein COA67_07720 [Lutibacter sp.]
MNTKTVMIISALFLGVLGITLSFFTQEVDAYLNNGSNTTSTLFLQLLGALYLGFAIMNWMAKDTRIGGIYNRPIAIGNFMHFGVGALALIKIVSKVELNQKIIIVLAIVYSIFALCFAFIFRINPKMDIKK